MKKLLLSVFFNYGKVLSKLTRIMKLIFLLVFICTLQVSAKIYSQDRFTLTMSNVTLDKVFDKIQKESDYRFFYNYAYMKNLDKVSIMVQNESLPVILDKLLANTLNYSILENNLVIITPKEIRPVQRRIEGKVTDENGTPLSGVSVEIKGTNQGTATESSGEFSLTVPENATLVVSFIGYQTQEISIGSKSYFEVQLKVVVSGLNEVVVVGFGEQRRRNITGAITSVDSKLLENRPVTRVEEALQGAVSGLSVIRGSGQPGAQTIDFKIRGTSTFSNNPVLTIIDGIPSSLNTVNPNDIESISVLKDAASAAIYGSRASGGVILVTTKSGKKGEPSVKINSILSLQSPTRFPSRVSAYQHMIAQNQMRANDGGPQKYTDEEIAASLLPGYKEWDWDNFMFGNALQTNQNISISGGSETQNYYASFGYLDQNGIFINSGYKKFNFQFNQNIKLSKKLKLRYKVSYAPEKTISPSSTPWNIIFQTSSLIGIRTDDGKWLTHPERTGDGRNAIYAASEEGGRRLIKGSTILANLSMDYQLLKNLTLNGSYSVVVNQSRDRNYTKKLTFYDQYNPDVIASTTDYNILNINNISNNQYDLSFLLNYKKSLGEHSFTALAGVASEWYKGQNDQVTTRDFLTEDIHVINGGTRDKALWDISGSASDWALGSLISRVTYAYKGKYLMEAAARYDGSSRFKEKIRWGLFPSASLGWIVSEENFLSNSDFLSFLKIRASWGQVGNQNVGLYPFANLLSQSSTFFGGTVYRAVGTAGAPNPLLTWETKESLNLGIEGRLFANLLEFNVELFKEKTKDILLMLPLPTTFGQSAPVQNAGRVDNTGWELELAHRNMIGKLHYGITFQVSDATNRVRDMKGISPVINGNQITEEGYSMNEWFGLRSIGIFQSDEEVAKSPFQNPVTSAGDLKFQQNGGDPNTINSDDRVRLGRSDARYPFGLRINLNFRNFDFIAFGQGVMFNLIYSTGPASQNFYAEASTLRTYQLDSWTPENTNARFPKYRNGQLNSVNSQFSSFWLEDASYFRLKQLEVGYKIDDPLLKRIKLKHARIFFNAENLFVFTKYMGYDPEMPNAASYPLPKLLSAGLNIHF